MILQQSVTWSIHKAYRQFFRELTVLKRTLVQKKTKHFKEETPNFLNVFHK